VAVWEFMVEVEPSLEVGESFMESPGFHAGLNPLQHVVFSLNLSDDCPLVDFQFDVPFVVMVVMLNFGVGSGVLEDTGLFSQGVIGPPSRLEQLDEPWGQWGGRAA